MSKLDIHNTLQIIAESIPGNVAIIKPDGDIIAVNQNWLDFAVTNGLKRNYPWNTLNYFEICQKVDGEDKELANQVSDGILNLLQNIVTTISFEYPCHSPSKKRWFELRANLLQLENKTFIITIHQDVTEKVKAQNKLKESQKMFRIIRENAPYGIGLSKGNVSHYANAKLLSLLEYDNFQNFVDTPLIETAHPEDRHIIGEKLKLIQEERAQYPFNVKARFITTTGKTRYFSVDIYEITINKDEYNLYNVVDETDKIATERSEKQLVIDALYLNRKQEILESFSQFIEGIKDKYEFQDNDLKHFSEIKTQFKFQASDWNLMKTHFQVIHKDFFYVLSERFPVLTQHDLNFCAMLKLNFSTKEIARYLNIKAASVKRRKIRLKKKLNLTEEDNLIAYIRSF